MNEAASLNILPESSRDLSALRPEFRASVVAVLAACAGRGIELIPTCTWRSPADQARLWRQSRTTVEIYRKITELQETDREVAAWILSAVGPQSGKLGAHVTHALPGESWHQWGQAVDVAWIVDGVPCWDAPPVHGIRNGYDVFRTASAYEGLRTGPHWDWCHIQGHAGTPVGALEAGLEDFFTLGIYWTKEDEEAPAGGVIGAGSTGGEPGRRTPSVAPADDDRKP